MKMREEIDALTVMGLRPIDVLIVPRLVALIICLPMLTFVADMSALFGGLLVTWGYGGISPETFMLRLPKRRQHAQFPDRHDQGALYGAHDRRHRLDRGPGRGRFSRIAWPPGHDIGR